MGEFEFDPYAAAQAIQDEIDWQLKEWERERMEEMYGE